jgi:hypothetical protein
MNVLCRSLKYIFLTFFLSTSLSGANKIVYLISTPRSLSTAFLRMMQARGDFVIFNEPSQCSFVAQYNPELIDNLYKDHAPQNFGDVKRNIFDATVNSHVFVKEMWFAIEDFILHDDALLQNSNVYFIFLVRDPHHALISFYNKQVSTPNFSISYSLFSHLMSYKGLYDFVHRIKEKSAHIPLIICAEDLYSAPEKVARLICDYLDIDFKEGSLAWSDLGTDFTGYEEWHENKLCNRTQLWHGEAIRSTGFTKPTSYTVDSNGIPTFAEIDNEEHRKMCMDISQENANYYTLLLKEALKV